MKPTIWIFSLEPIESRYTAQWHEHFPKLISNKLGDKFNVVQVDGIQKDSQLTPGAFLNFSDTNYWKSSQLCNFLEHHNAGETSPDDHIIYTDAWNPTVIQIKYMSDLLGFNWTLHGMFHAGSYDPQDFLGRLIGNKPWVRTTEASFYHAFDHNYFATEFHIELFAKTFGSYNGWADLNIATKKIIQTGWPMEYMTDTLAPYANLKKRDLVLFPHRIAPEKQVEIFRDLAKKLPEYEFVVCQDQSLTKDEYHTLLGQAKVVFSANLQETLGISCYEGALVGAIPMVPDRLSYTEMYPSWCKYPSLFTEDWDSYQKNKKVLIKALREHMTHYEHRVNDVKSIADGLTTDFFSSDNLLKNIK